MTSPTAVKSWNYVWNYLSNLLILTLLWLKLILCDYRLKVSNQPRVTTFLASFLIGWTMLNITNEQKKKKKSISVISLIKTTTPFTLAGYDAGDYDEISNARSWNNFDQKRIF